MTSARTVAQRLNNAFVFVPPSPFSLDQYRPLKGTQLHASTKLKENIPLPPFYVSILQSFPSSSSLKRKMDDRDQPPHTTASATKKAKHPVTISPKAKQTQHASEEEYPNGFIYCHQCNRKRDLQGKLLYSPPPPYVHLVHSQCSMHLTQATGDCRRCAGKALSCKILQILLNESLWGRCE